jgi:hypothetical protein
MLAAGLNIVAFVAPLFVIFRVVLRRWPQMAWPMTVLGTVLLLSNPITNAGFYMIHVDGLCIGWALVACTALFGRTVLNWRPGFVVAAFALALSVATKQVAVVLIPATLLWMWREGHGKLIWGWIFWLAVVCGGLAVVVLVAFGPEELLFNAWLLFSRMPWRGGWLMLGTNLLEVLRSCWLWCASAVTAWLLFKSGKKEGVRPSLEAVSFARLLGWIAVIQMPMGLTASLLVDAELNSIHAPTYLLISGLVLGGSFLTELSKVGNPKLRIRPWLSVGTIAMTGLSVAFYLCFDRPAVWKPFRGQEEVLAMVKRSPGKIYLPWNPLITIIAERKIYPFDEALHYLWLARLEPPRAAIRAAVPAGAFVVYHEPCQTHFALNYFGEKHSPAEISLP